MGVGIIAEFFGTIEFDGRLDFTSGDARSRLSLLLPVTPSLIRDKQNNCEWRLKISAFHSPPFRANDARILMIKVSTKAFYYITDDKPMRFESGFFSLLLLYTEKKSKSNDNNSCGGRECKRRRRGVQLSRCTQT